MRLQPTIHDIAEAAHVSTATVSRALHNQGRISKATRDRIKALAEKMGYRLNPFVTTWMSHVRSNKKGIPFRGNLALLDYYDGPKDWIRSATDSKFHHGAAERAKKLGFTLNRFWANESGMTAARLVSILRQRSIDGVVIPIIVPFKQNGQRIDFKFGDFACAMIGGYRTSAPELHFATNDQYSTTLLACMEMTRLGYRRLGLVIPNYSDECVEGRFSAAFLGFQARLEPSQRIPIFFQDLALDVCKLKQWLDQYRPDGVLGLEERSYTELRKIRKIPGEIGFAHLDLTGKQTELAGVNQKNESVGAAAVDLVVEQLSNNERGIPRSTKGIFLEGVWHHGDSAPVCH